MVIVYVNEFSFLVWSMKCEGSVVKNICICFGIVLFFVVFKCLGFLIFLILLKL